MQISFNWLEYNYELKIVNFIASDCELDIGSLTKPHQEYISK